MLNQVAGLLWVASAIMGGYIHYTERGQLWPAVLAATSVLAAQLAAAVVTLGFIVQFYATRGDAIEGSTGLALALSVPAFWLTMAHKFGVLGDAPATERT